MTIGKGRIVEEGSKIAILNLGTRLAECRKAATLLNAQGLSTTVADMRFAKPLDMDMILRLARSHEVLLTVEEGSIGGFGSYVLHHLASLGMLDRGLKIRPLCLPDIFQEHDAPVKQYDEAGLSAAKIAAKAMEAMGVEGVASVVRA